MNEKPIKEEVIKDIIELRYNQFYSNGNIVIHLFNEYGYKQSRAYQLIKEAKQEMADAYAKTTDDVLAEAINKLESMQQDSRKAGTHKLTYQIQQELNKIQQLHIQKLEIDANMNIEVPLFGPIIKKEDNKDEEN